jgi:hypothetical protein
MCDGVSGTFDDIQGLFLPGGRGADGLCVFSHVFPQYGKESGGESMVPEQGDEGQGLFPEKEKGIRTAQRISYL